MEELRTEIIRLDKLRPYERNARKHSEPDVKAIAASIKKFGFNDPVGIWGDNVIVEGHGRCEAAKMLGMESVPCIRLDHLTDEQRRAYALAHNKTAELSEWDEEMLNFELAGLEEMNMADFGFEIKTEAFPDMEGLFTEAEPKEKEPKKHICPHCGALVEVE